MTCEQFEHTNYGIKHAESRDLLLLPRTPVVMTGKLLVSLGVWQKISAALVINKNFLNRPIKMQIMTSRSFLKILINYVGSRHATKYLWKRKHPETRCFYKDIVEYCDMAKSSQRGKKNGNRQYMSTAWQMKKSVLIWGGWFASEKHWEQIFK